MDIRVGSVVYILSGRCRFWHEWGIVDEIKGSGKKRRFHVKFGKGVGSVMDRPSDFWHEQVDLEVHDKMPISALADYLFGKGMCHSTQEFKYPFDETCRCHHRSHDALPEAPRAVKRLLLNCCGMACEFDVCEEHRGMDKFWYEILPWSERKPSGAGLRV